VRIDPPPRSNGSVPEPRRSEDQREQFGERLDHARFVAGDKERTDQARTGRGDEREAQIAGPDREALAGLGQAEDGELRARSDRDETQSAAAFGKGADDCRNLVPFRSGRIRRRSERDHGCQGQAPQRNMPGGEDQRSVGSPTEGGEFRDEMDAGPAPHGESREAKDSRGSERRTHWQANLQPVGKFLASSSRSRS
jgi:hypothetical protein